MPIQLRTALHSTIFLSFLLLLVPISTEKVCDTTTGVCSAASEQQQCSSKYNDFPLCRPYRSVYQYGGTAQAYKADVPVNNTVCGDSYLSGKHRVATWPYSQSSRQAPPKISLQLHFWSCEKSSDNACCCKELNVNNQYANGTVSIWQTRPDGTYSSLRKGVDDDDCRATMPLSGSPSSVRFDTVAPGSTGSLGGLGPNKWDFMPYGPPVIHILVTATGHAPLLLDLPILVDKKTLSSQKFRWRDWRGAGWSRGRLEPPMKMRNWKANVKANQIQVELDVFLSRGDEHSLCESSIPYIPLAFPSSFFLKPISECSPSVLDFYAL